MYISLIVCLSYCPSVRSHARPPARPSVGRQVGPSTCIHRLHVFKDQSFSYLKVENKTTVFSSAECCSSSHGRHDVAWIQHSQEHGHNSVHLLGQHGRQEVDEPGSVQP